MLIKNKLWRIVSVPRELGIHLIATDWAELYIEEEKLKKAEVKSEEIKEVKVENLNHLINKK